MQKGTQMAKKTSASTQREKQTRKNAAAIRAYAKTPAYREEVARLRAMPDSQIDYSDLPPLTDEQLARMVRTRLKPQKTPVSIRLDTDILAWLKKQQGLGYQTRINRLLREVMERSAV